MKSLKIFGLALLSSFFAFAYANAQNGSIKVGSVSGKVTVINGSAAAAGDAAEGQVFTPPATVITDSDASVVLYLSNGSVVEVKPSSRVEFTHFSQDPFEPVDGDPFQPLQAEPSSSQVSIRVVSGEIAANIPTLASGSTFLINTPTSDIEANGVVVVVGYDAETAGTRVANVSGNGSVVYESSTTGGTPTTVASGEALSAPGQIDPATGTPTTAGEPTTSPVQPSDNEAAGTVTNPPVAPTTPPSQPTTPPAAPSITPELDIPDLINPTSTEPTPA